VTKCWISGFGIEHRKQVVVLQLDEFYGMGQSAIPAVLELPQKPEDGGQEIDWGFHEKFALLTGPGPVNA
jgi:hypothetical protein